MHRLLLVSSLLSLCSSRYVIHDDGEGGAIFRRLFKSERRLTVRELNTFLTAMNEFPEYVPKEVMLVFQNLSSRTKKELVTFVNEIRGDHVELSAEPSETIEIIRQRLPELGKNINTALNKLIKTIRKLPAPNKEAFQKYWIIFFESISAPAPLRSMFLAAFFAELHNSFRRAEDSTLVEIYKASPQTFLLLRSDFTKEFAYAAKKYARRDLKMKAPLDEQDGF